EAAALARSGTIAVIVDPQVRAIQELRPEAVVDARMAKRNLGITRKLAPLVVGLGPGFVAGVDCHAVVETNRGHDLGRVLWSGAAESNTGRAAEIGGHGPDRVLRAPQAGIFRPVREIGDRLQPGE